MFYFSFGLNTPKLTHLLLPTGQDLQVRWRARVLGGDQGAGWESSRNGAKVTPSRDPRGQIDGWVLDSRFHSWKACAYNTGTCIFSQNQLKLVWFYSPNTWPAAWLTHWPVASGQIWCPSWRCEHVEDQGHGKPCQGFRFCAVCCQLWSHSNSTTWKLNKDDKVSQLENDCTTVSHLIRDNASLFLYVHIPMKNMVSLT